MTLNFFRKEDVVRVTGHVTEIWYVYVSRDNPDMTHYNFSEKGMWPGSSHPH